MTVDEIIADVKKEEQFDASLTADTFWTHATVAVLVAEIEHLRDEAEWRPIETAPRDGSVVFLCRDGWRFTGCWSCNIEEWVAGCWSCNIEEWVAAKKTYQLLSPYEVPTHWRPLPPPPKEEPGE